MSQSRAINETRLEEGPSMGDFLIARPSGLLEPEAWAIMCQAVQALQDLFLSDGASGGLCIPLVTPATLMLSSKGRVKLCQSNKVYGSIPPAHLAGYLAPEYRPTKQYTDTEAEKMWIYSLGETLKRAALTSNVATSRLSGELCQVLTDMTRLQASTRASLMHLLDVISRYFKRKHQTKPHSHIVMDLHQEAMAALELSFDTPWGPPAMPELRPRTRNRSESNADGFGTIPRRWVALTRTHHDNSSASKLTKEASTSMNDLTSTSAPGSVVRPKSMCVPNNRNFNCNQDPNFVPEPPPVERLSEITSKILTSVKEENGKVSKFGGGGGDNNSDGTSANPNINNRRLKVRRNPVQRAASRLYRAGIDVPTNGLNCVSKTRDTIGPEFVVRASLTNKQLTMPDIKGNVRKTVTVIMLNGQKLDITCNPNTTTSGQLFELIIQKELIEENFMLGLSALIAGDFVFLPSDTRICKAFHHGSTQSTLTLFMRVRFFLPTLRGIRGPQARHLLYLQLRRSILEHQLPCSFPQLIELDGLALQAEFGNYSDREHGTRDYFLLEHYVPETMSCAIDDSRRLRQELIKAHQARRCVDPEKAEQDFIIVSQKLPHYGGHFYTATWMLKDNNDKDVWLYISAQGINLYERGKTTSNFGPQLYEMFEWRSIQTLCYSKQYLCILPHSTMLHASKLKKYKLKMDHKKSYFAFRLASLHHQFFLRLRIEYASLQSLSQQFGIPLKDMKNETNSLYKLDVLTNHEYMTIEQATMDADPEFKIDFRASSTTSNELPPPSDNPRRRSRSVNDFHDDHVNEEHQNKENENPGLKMHSGLVLDSSYLSGLHLVSTDKRRGVKMGTRAFCNAGPRVSRSMEAVNASNDEYLEQMSLQSVSLHCSSNNSMSRSPTAECLPSNEAYILDATNSKNCTHPFLPDFQESLSDSLLHKLNTMSFAEERVLSTVIVERDMKGSLGMQITEGSDGNVYVQSVILGGAAHLTGNVLRGDQVIAVDGKALLGVPYIEALSLLKDRGNTVEFLLSRITPNSGVHSQSTLRMSDLKSVLNLTNITEPHVKNCTAVVHQPRSGDSPIEKHLTESCYDTSNLHKYGAAAGGSTQSEVPYHKHIRYEIEPERTATLSSSKSCTNLSNGSDRAVVVEMIPKENLEPVHFQSIDPNENEKITIPSIALPRSLGLSRKWKGPVRYPVTPIKKIVDSGEGDPYSFSTSDEEQVFI